MHHTSVYLTGLLAAFTAAASRLCKSTPNDDSWPTISQWSHLNQSLSGRLIRAIPPALDCHSTLPSSNESCAHIGSLWKTFAFHQDDPVSTAWNNMNNDSCLPSLSAPCSGIGYPVYVVNATCAEHVKMAIDFARKYEIRLNVKASGHDYLKRYVGFQSSWLATKVLSDKLKMFQSSSASPYSLSIWTRHMVGEFEYHDRFTPRGCDLSINTTAVTVAAGSSVNDVYSNLAEHHLTAVDGMGPEVTVGGYLTGGGHSPISNIFGLGSDQVYEVELVTPTGEVLIANECQNIDLFWAVRGGGGSSFGVLTKVTIRTVPSRRMSAFVFTIEADSASEAYWESVVYTLARYPELAESNVAAFTYLYPTGSDPDPGKNKTSFEAVFALYDPPTTDTLENLLAPVVRHVNATYSGEVMVKTSKETFPDFIGVFKAFADDAGAGVDKVVGSRLLPAEVLTNREFKKELKIFLGQAGGRLYMISGEGVWNAVPRGGSTAVNPAWRKALIHAVASQDWTPLDQSEKRAVEQNISSIQVEAFRRLAPDSGAYLNEAYWDEPNFQQAFWGDNYDRLHQIKKAVDPDDVFWCHVCVGSEGWKENDNHLCKVD